MSKLQEAVRKRHENDEGGFTLIELLIVIIILGILAAVVVFAVGGITDRGAKSACKADAKAVNVAAEAYFAQNGTPVASMFALIPTFMHPDAAITAGAPNTKVVGSAGSANGYTITFTPGTTDAGNANGLLNNGGACT